MTVRNQLDEGSPSYIWRHTETLSVGQREQLVVIQHRVEIFNPLGVDVAVKDDPLAFLQFASDVVNDSKVQRKSSRNDISKCFFVLLSKRDSWTKRKQLTS